MAPIGDGGTATEFMQDLAGRLANRVMLTTDGHKMYLGAVEDAFQSETDYAMLVKNYANLASGPETGTARPNAPDARST